MLNKFFPFFPFFLSPFISDWLSAQQIHTLYFSVILSFAFFTPVFPLLLQCFVLTSAACCSFFSVIISPSFSFSGYLAPSSWYPSVLWKSTGASCLPPARIFTFWCLITGFGEDLNFLISLIIRHLLFRVLILANWWLHEPICWGLWGRDIWIWKIASEPWEECKIGFLWKLQSYLSSSFVLWPLILSGSSGCYNNFTIWVVYGLQCVCVYIYIFGH